uniref:Bestrophin homolog n=1 Tax=Ascaris lumbricoides TaxID=6252 RepID=A0A0M3HT99_ASCLU
MSLKTGASRRHRALRKRTCKPHQGEEVSIPAALVMAEVFGICAFVLASFGAKLVGYIEKRKNSQPESHIIRCMIARYTLLTAVLAQRSISIRVLKRYPTDEHLVQSGLPTRKEQKMLTSIRVEMGTLTHTNEMRVILDSLGKYRQGFFRLFIYDWISIPLVCTEVCPIFTVLQSIFYAGWLKVGEDLLLLFAVTMEIWSSTSF